MELQPFGFEGQFVLAHESRLCVWLVRMCLLSLFMQTVCCSSSRLRRRMQITELITDESHRMSPIHRPAVVSLQPMLLEDSQGRVQADQSE